MLALPRELLDLIFHHVSRADIKNLRLVSKSFDSSASLLLITRVYISSHALDLQVFQNVTGHSTFKRTVKEIVWDDSTFNRQLMDWDLFCYQVMLWWHVSHEDAGHMYQRWIHLARDHHEIRERRLDEDALNKALTTLPSLEKVTLTHIDINRTDVDIESPTRRLIRKQRIGRKFSGPPNPGVAWYTCSQRNLSEPTDPFDLDSLDDGLTGLQWMQQMRGGDYEVSHLVHDTTRMFRGFLILIRALARAPIKVKSFAIRPPYSLSNVEPHGGISHSLFKKWSPDLDHLANVVQHLTVLHLSLSCDDRINTWENMGVVADHLRLILSQAVQLEDLELDLEAMPTVDLLDSGITYPRLKKMRLAEGYCWPEKLSSFLRRQRHVLRVLLIDRIFLYGLWRLVLDDFLSEAYAFDTCLIQNVSDGASSYICEDLAAVAGYLYHGGPYPLKVS
ncbi:MAG: hypothetical protein LQ347_002124 [Umbilicaria vellea]|nr:MAG: hypothetical protein LQ347_002124 [Umbilicaria vellea]